MPDRSASAARVTAAPEPKVGSARASRGTSRGASRAGSTGNSSGRLALDPGRVSVLLPLPLTGAYDYALPSDLELAPGDVVQVPLGTREVIGVVWDAPDRDDGLAADRLKTVIARYDVPPLPVVERRFVEWVANYTMAPAGAVLRMALSSPGALETPRPIAALRATANQESLERLRLTSARRRVLAVAEDGLARPAPELARAAGVGSSVVKGLLEAGALESVELPPPAAFAPPDATAPGPPLTVAQQEAAAALRERTRATEDGPPGFSVSLLDGVTGSGKTEVYFEAVAEALAAGRQVLVLLPEIALSAQWLARFEARFGVPPAQWHSDLPSRVRRITWRAVAFGEARLVVGARSALFLPFQDLGLIVVDEEHEAAFKQEDGVIYHARDMAVVRARLGEFPIVLVSATPSLESVTNVRSGRYRLQHLPERHGSAGLPEITLIDMRAEKPPSLPGLGQSWLSPSLRAAVTETLAAGEQVLLFLNRRGYAPLTLCRACGHRLDCPNCTAWLVEHRLSGKLQCHHCGYWSSLPTHCPKCEAEGSLAACGPGVERLADEVAALFPDARRALMSSDTVTGPESAATLVKAVQDGEVDLLIGTQIVAKGNHFPNLTCVGVIDADLGLGGGDLRAAERTYQLLGQVAGRAGRAERPGRVLIQTFEPGHPVMQALRSGDRERFLAAESETRRAAVLPPFGRLAALILSAPQPGLVDEACRRLARAAPRSEGVDVFGPAPAPLAILRRQHRRRFLLRTRRDVAPQPVLRAWLAAVELPRQVRLRIDIDPYSFL